MTSTPFTIPPETPQGRLVFPVLGATLGILFLLTRHPLAPPFATATAGILGLGYLPGLAASLWIERRFGLWSSWILPLILSPVIVVALALIGAWFGLPLAVDSWIVLLSVVAVCFAPQPGREIEDWAVSLEMPSLIRTRSDRQQVILLAGVVLIMIAGTLLSSPWLRSGGEAAYHLAVIREVGISLPPLDPLLSATPLRDFWAFHVYLAVLEHATRMDGEFLLLGGSLIGAFTLVFAGYRLMTLLGLSHTRSLWGAVFMFFSLGSAAFLYEVFRAVTGGDGLGALLESLGTLTTVEAQRGLDPSRSFLLEPFLRPGPSIVVFSYLLLFLMGATATPDENRRRWNSLTALSVLGMLLFHAGIGLVVVATTVLAVPVAWVSTGLHPFKGAGLRLLGVLGASVIALVVAIPYLRELGAAGGFELGAFLEFSGAKTLYTLGAVAPQLIAAVIVGAAFLAADEPRRPVFTVWWVLFLAVLLALRFAGLRPLATPIYLAQILLGLTAGTLVPVLWERFHRWTRPLVVLAVILLVVPRTALGVHAYLSAEDPRDLRPETVEVTQWIEENTPPDAVLVDAEPDLALQAHRSLLMSSRARLLSSERGGTTLAIRSLAYVALLSGETLTDAQRAHLLAQRRPIVVVYRLPDRADAYWPSEYTEVFRNSAYILFRWDPSRSGGTDGG